MRCSDVNTVFIRGLEVRAVIGVHDWERVKPQSLELELEIGLAHISRRRYLAIGVTRQTMLPTSSANRIAPALSTATPTGRP